MTAFDEGSAIRRVIELMGIPGQSCQEHQVAEYICSTLKKAGLPASAVSFDSANRKSPAGGETGNLVVRLKGTGKAPRRLMMAHMDTVPLAVGCKPVRDGDWIRPASKKTALGGDNRAGCAAILTAVLEILSRKLPHPPLTLLFTVQEEIGLRGARYVTTGKLGKPQLCFNWDGRDPAALIIGGVGATNLSISIQGIASHAGVHPEQGVNAGVVASLAIADLQQNGWHGLVTKGRNRGASNIGVIQGGAATNVVMPELSIEAEARSHKPAFRQRIVREFRKAFDRAAAAVSTIENARGSLVFEEDTRYEAFAISPRAECVTVAKSAVTSVGRTPDVRSCDGGLDSSWLSSHGFPTVTMGCGQHNIHTVDEVLNVPEYVDGCRIALSIATGDSTSD